MVVTEVPETSYHRAERERFERLDRESPFARKIVDSGFPRVVARISWLSDLLRKQFGGYRNG
jgi:hypothetical protein